jgi:hypothetical protein
MGAIAGVQNSSLPCDVVWCQGTSGTGGPGWYHAPPRGLARTTASGSMLCTAKAFMIRCSLVTRDRATDRTRSPVRRARDSTSSTSARLRPPSLVTHCASIPGASTHRGIRPPAICPRIWRPG